MLLQFQLSITYRFWPSHFFPQISVSNYISGLCLASFSKPLFLSSLNWLRYIDLFVFTSSCLTCLWFIIASLTFDYISSCLIIISFML
jgi:hypothetical protein